MRSRFCACASSMRSVSPRVLALGLASATQGRYRPEQAVLDMTAGARTSSAAYKPNVPPPLALVPAAAAGAAARGRIAGWKAVLARASTALAEIRPGLLGAHVAGGAAYAGVSGGAQLGAVVAADPAGVVARVSLGPAVNLAGRAHS